MAHRVVAVIPARLNSKRFSNKVIYPLNGKPLLSYVHREVSSAKTVDRVVIATDSRIVARSVEAFGAHVVMTSTRHRTGSDRVAEAATKTGGDIILNVQADNFGLKGPVIDRMVRLMVKDYRVQFATMAHRITNDGDLFSPDMVKVVMDKCQNALWFTRLPVPYLQGCHTRRRYDRFVFWGHIGVYGFRRRSLEQFASWKRTPLEKAESLEQLRILENGGDIRVLKTIMSSISVNDPADLKKLKRIYK